MYEVNFTKRYIPIKFDNFFSIFNKYVLIKFDEGFVLYLIVNSRYQL